MIAEDISIENVCFSNNNNAMTFPLVLLMERTFITVSKPFNKTHKNKEEINDIHFAPKDVGGTSETPFRLSLQQETHSNPRLWGRHSNQIIPNVMIS